MKTSLTLLALGLFAAVQAAAADQSTNTTASATATFSKTQVQPSYPVNEYKLEPTKIVTADRGKPLRYEGLGSQAWTTIATRHSDSFLFDDARRHEPQTVLCYWGHEPW